MLIYPLKKIISLLKMITLQCCDLHDKKDMIYLLV